MRGIHSRDAEYLLFITLCNLVKFPVGNVGARKTMLAFQFNWLNRDNIIDSPANRDF